MDLEVARALRSAGFDLEGGSEPLELDLRPESLDEEVRVVQGKKTAVVLLRPISGLWTGDREPPDLSGGYPAEYIPFFLALEGHAARYCVESGRVVIDREFERVYELLRRRPDGNDPEPVFRVRQAAARLYLSLHTTSRAEYEAVVRRLARSARTFSFGIVSRNYWEHALEPLLEEKS